MLRLMPVVEEKKKFGFFMQDNDKVHGADQSMQALSGVFSDH